MRRRKTLAAVTRAPGASRAPAPRAQVETPLELAPRLSERLGRGNTVLLKREDMQPVFSFKARSRLSLPIARLYISRSATRACVAWR